MCAAQSAVTRDERILEPTSKKKSYMYSTATTEPFRGSMIVFQPQTFP